MEYYHDCLLNFILHMTLIFINAVQPLLKVTLNSDYMNFHMYIRSSYYRVVILTLLFVTSIVILLVAYVTVAHKS